MVYTVIILAIIFYLTAARMTYGFTKKVKNTFFGQVTTREHAPLSLLWPVTLPSFYSIYWYEIKAVKRGWDWADMHIPDETVRKEFRVKYMNGTA